jgi:hypothetical protein
VIPRPSDGFVQAQESPTLTIPVATGTPSTTKRRRRSMVPPKGSTSVIGSPSSQCACNGHAATRAVQCRGSRSFFSAWSPEEMNTVIDQVPASPGRTRSENEWKYV